MTAPWRMPTTVAPVSLPTVERAPGGASCAASPDDEQWWDRGTPGAEEEP